MTPPKKLLTIAGSDSGGAAGLQADLRTWAVLGVYGMSVVTAVTAQNSLAVQAVQFMPPNFITNQLDAVLSDYGADAVKTGFLGHVDTIKRVAAKLHQYALPHVVIDPVLVNHRGESMFPSEVAQAYIDHLLPLADLVTPNLAEARLLTGLAVDTLAEAETAVHHIQQMGSQHVLLKRVPHHNQFIDLFFDGKRFVKFETSIVNTKNTHGSGDTLSAAISAFLAKAHHMKTAVHQAHQFTNIAIQNTVHWHFSAGHGPVWPTQLL